MAKREIKVPTMGESVKQAQVSQLLAKHGDTVKLDQEIIELETDKVNQILYAPASGVLELSISIGDTVAIEQVIGAVNEDKTAVAAPSPPLKPVVTNPAPSAPTKNTRQDKDSALASLLSTPMLKPSPPTPKAVSLPSERSESRTKMTKIRRVIAQKLLDVQTTTAMLTTFNEVDMSAVMDLRNTHKDEFEKAHGTKLGFMSFFVKASVAALKAIPTVNSYIDGEDLVTRHFIDIGIAVGTEKGLFVPVVRNCDQLSFSGIEKAIAQYADKARSGGISVDDLQGGSFTITNGGVYGSLLSTPIINPPQCAILGMHTIKKRPIVVDDEIVIRPMMYLALSYDHRIIDGKEAVTFLVMIKNALENPSRLLLELA